ncbi:galactokinase [Enterococcus gallinarum]|uniref:Galactokinase n=1 Tax=Enterococcus gallinarum TaxID=1353 RepID=A0A376GWD8_ENTGA|nr:galactokinase [Enterococcus gallinarum]MCC4045498.1 galactokinase [Enterococcus gallinarum]MDT2686614.1 galactokinase [Enterococcus gallinarum]STD72470.1 galactokinase [Enterococcus gallinarum]STD82901.1 galactokinase [Enterococcus gallinarum]
MEQLQQIFAEKFGEKGTGSYFAPGRINLIGEHTDYNGGYVFPASITIGTYGVARKRADKQIRLYSENFPEKGIITFSLDDLEYRKEDDWTNYPKGVIRYLKAAGHAIDSGIEIAFYGNIPNGAGLSSSASIELLTGVILDDLFGLAIERLELILTGKKVENEFIGVNSGIMDQFAIGMGKKDHALLLDTNTLAYDLVPAEFGDYVVAIMNTNKRRELADSKYNERRGECEEALKRLQTKLKIQSLGELDEATFFAYTSLIEDPTLIKRAKHAVTENQRTLKAKAALEAGDLESFGHLLDASHASLRDDYEVTGIELDTLVAAAQEQPAVLGARMTGAGFGGCAIALVKKSEWEAFATAVKESYREKIGYETDIYQASIDDGARKL